MTRRPASPCGSDEIDEVAALLLVCSASGFTPPRSPLLGAPLLRNAAVRKLPVAVASAGRRRPADTSPLPPSAASPSGVLDAADAVYRFSRPHTIRGTLLACFTGVGRALIEAPEYLPLLLPLLPRALLGVLALLLGNLFIVGINQIYDVEIDEINKPYLPIAAGRISKRAAWAIVAGSGIAALAIVRAVFSPLIFALFAFGTAIGGLYSVPPIQLKRFPLAAGLTIATCRGFLLNFGKPRTEHSHTRAARPRLLSLVRSPLFCRRVLRDARGARPLVRVERARRLPRALHDRVRRGDRRDEGPARRRRRHQGRHRHLRLAPRRPQGGERRERRLALNYAAAVATACLRPPAPSGGG